MLMVTPLWVRIKLISAETVHPILESLITSLIMIPQNLCNITFDVIKRVVYSLLKFIFA